MIINDVEINELKRYFKHFDFSKSFSNKTFLITGYKGLIGTGLTKWLLFLNEQFDSNIKIFLSSRRPEELPFWLEKKDNVCLSRYLDEDSNVNYIDYIIHLAAPTDKKYFVKEPIDSIDSIYEGTKYYLEYSKNQNNCKFIFLSSVEAYGCPNSANDVSEDYVGEIDSLNIRNGYPLGKKAAEFLCFAYYKKYNLHSVIVRPSSIQGLFQKYQETRIFNEILRCIIEKKDFVMKTDGLTKKSLIYTLDAVSGIFTILLKGKPCQAYNLTNPFIYMTMNDYVSYLFSIYNPEHYIVHDKISKISDNSFLPKVEYNLSVKKIMDLGWEPITDLETIYKVDIERL